VLVSWEPTWRFERPTRIVDTWLFEGWPDAEAVETVDLQETDGVTKLTMKMGVP